jgi:hypothetical protein
MRSPAIAINGRIWSAPGLQHLVLLEQAARELGLSINVAAELCVCGFQIDSEFFPDHQPRCFNNNETGWRDFQYNTSKGN